MKPKLCFMFSVLLFLVPYFLCAQLSLNIRTDKNIYNYGEPIIIECTVTNISEKDTTVISSSTGTCQAEFIFNDFYSRHNTMCLPMVEYLHFSPGGSMTYQWTIESIKMGLPDRNGEQILVGEFLGGLLDTIFINAPKFYGGQLRVGFYDSLKSEIEILKQDLNVSVIENSFYSFDSSFSELWQIEGLSIDSVQNVLFPSGKFKYAILNRMIAYDKISTTGISDNIIPDNYKLSDAFPNPFNPSTSFYLSVDEPQNVEIALYTSIGERVAEIFNGYLNVQQNYKFNINGENLPSGVYFYTAKGEKFNLTKKVVLLK